MPLGKTDLQGTRSRLAFLAPALRDWYLAHRRDLPWRRTRDPYPILVSEIMLQQTRVEVVEPFYERFLDRFPTVEALAAASQEDVLAAWSGLGYYRRARLLHAAAGAVQDLGAFPETVEGLRELPGIGPYTAAAVASIAFGVCTPVLDGNVERVLARVLLEGRDPKRAATRRRMLEAAAALLVAEHAGDSNQAMMELGARVCTPKNPSCGACPLQPECRAERAGVVERYPPVRAKPIKTWQVRLAALVCRRNQILLVRRPDDARVLPGSWMLPEVVLHTESPVPRGRRPEIEWSHEDVERRLGQPLGVAFRLGGPEVRVRHGITTRSIDFFGRPAEVEGEIDGPGVLWCAPDELDTLHTSSVLLKLLEQFRRCALL